MGLFHNLFGISQEPHAILFKAAKNSIKILMPDKINDRRTELECILMSTSYIFIMAHNKGIHNYHDFTIQYSKLLFNYISENNLVPLLKPNPDNFIDSRMNLYSKEFYAVNENNRYLPARLLTAILNPLSLEVDTPDDRVFNPKLSLNVTLAYSMLSREINSTL
jgi:hypothetical protein